LKINADDASAHKFLGIALFGLNRINEAASQLNEAVRLDPRDAEALQKLGEVRAATPH